MNRFKFLVCFLFFFISHTLHADTVLEMQNLFSGRNIYAPTLLFDNGVYKMWYSGWQDDGNYQDNIYYRTSSDNITWSFPTTILTPKYIENNADIAINIKHIGDPSITKHYNIESNTYQYTMFYTLCKEPCEQKNNQIWSAVSNDGINWMYHKVLLEDDNLGSAEPSAVVDPNNNSGVFWKVYYVDRLDAANIKMVTVDGDRNVITKKVVYSHEGTVTNPEVKNINNVWHLFFNNYFGSETLERASLNQTVSQSNESWVNYSVLIDNTEDNVCSTTTPGVLPSREDITQYHLYYGIVENSFGTCDLSNHSSIHRWTYKVQPNYPPIFPISTESVIIGVEFNQSIYHTGEQLRLDISVHGNEIIDLYVALFFPQDFFQTITYPFNFNMANAIMPYKTNIEMSGEKIFQIMNFVLPPGIPTGVYTCYGLATISTSNPWQEENWIHFDYKTFELK